MKNYFGRLVSARSGRGVLRPPRMVFGTSPRVAMAEPVSASRGTMAVSSKGAKAVDERAARPAPEAASGVVRERKAPPPIMTPVLRDAAKVSADEGRKPEAKPEEPKVRPVAGPVDAETSVRPRDAGPTLKPVAHAEKAEEEKAEPERRVAYPPPMQAEMEDAVAAAPRSAKAPLRPTSAIEVATPDARSMPAAPPVATPPGEDHAAEKPNSVLRPVMPVPLLPFAVAQRGLAEPTRQEQTKIEIGTIEVRIATPQKRGPGQTMRPVEAPARVGTLARGFFHSFGIRQG